MLFYKSQVIKVRMMIIKNRCKINDFNTLTQI